MNPPPPLPGVTTKMVNTLRLQQHVYFTGPEDGIPVIFLHGNFSAALYWEEAMLALPAGYRGIAPDLRGYGWTEDKSIDSTLGVSTWSEDVFALMEALHLQKAHLVGWSMGAGIVYRLIADHAGKVHTATLVCPVSPYGFGGTKGAEGTPCYADFAGSGGGVVNPVFVKLIQEGDRSTADMNSPRNVVNTFYYKAPFKAAREEDFLTAALMERSGPEAYPGDFVPSANWPNVAPGVKGPVNAWSPKYAADDVPALLAANPKPQILWVRGAADMIVSDMSMFDFGALGKLSYVPGWPGDEIYPPQPMIAQTRFVLDQYQAKGGKYQEYVVQEAAHSPHIEQLAEFNSIFHPFIS